MQIAEHIEHKHVEAGQIIVSKGTTANAMYIIFKGKVGIYLDKNINKPSSILGEKIQFGAEALERNAKRAAWVIAEEPTDLLVVKSGAFNSIIGVSLLFSSILTSALELLKPRAFQRCKIFTTNGVLPQMGS